MSEEKTRVGYRDKYDDDKVVVWRLNTTVVKPRDHLVRCTQAFS